jgi:hypothetical protein
VSASREAASARGTELVKDGKPSKVDVTVEASDAWWVFGLILMVLLCHGDPDLLDVLQEWCRRYMELRRG